MGAPEEFLIFAKWGWKSFLRLGAEISARWIVGMWSEMGAGEAVWIAARKWLNAPDVEPEAEMGRVLCGRLGP